MATWSLRSLEPSLSTDFQERMNTKQRVRLYIVYIVMGMHLSLCFKLSVSSFEQSTKVVKYKVKLLTLGIAEPLKGALRQLVLLKYELCREAKAG